MSNSPCVSQGNTSKAIWKENLDVYQKSLRAFFQATLQLQFQLSSSEIKIQCTVIPSLLASCDFSQTLFLLL